MEANNSATAESTAVPCGHCGENASQQCGQCKNMRYCSLECQQADWQFHKALCKGLHRAHAMESREENMRLAILLEEDTDEPIFLWIRCEVGAEIGSDAADVDLDDGDEDQVSADLLEARRSADDLGVPLSDCTGGKTHLPAVDTLCGKARAEGMSKMLVCGKRGGGERLAYSIHVVSGRSFNPQNTTPNKCLVNLMGPKAAARWPGMTVIYAMTKVYESSVVVNIDTRGFTLALDAMMAQDARSVRQEKISGVRLSAAEPYFEQVNVPVRHAVFTKGLRSPVTQLMGTPVRMYKQRALTVASTPPAAPAPDAPVNPAAWLQIVTDPASPEFGSIPTAVKLDPTTMLVVALVLSTETEGYPLEVHMLKSAIANIRLDVHARLNDTSKTPEERCQSIKFEMDAMVNSVFSGLMETMSISCQQGQGANGQGANGQGANGQDANGGLALGEGGNGPGVDGDGGELLGADGEVTGSAEKAGTEPNGAEAD